MSFEQGPNRRHFGLRELFALVNQRRDETGQLIPMRKYIETNPDHTLATQLVIEDMPAGRDPERRVYPFVDGGLELGDRIDAIRAQTADPQVEIMATDYQIAVIWTGNADQVYSTLLDLDKIANQQGELDPS